MSSSSSHVTFAIAVFVTRLIVSATGERCSRPYNCCEADPECPGTNSTVLLHTAVPGNATTQHYLLGTAGYPTILIAQSSTQPGKCTNNLWSLSVNMTEFISSQKEGSVKFDGDFSFKHDYSLALVFRSLVQFNVYDSEANDSFCSNCFSPSFWSSESFACNHTMQTYADVEKRDKQTYCVRPFTDITWGYIDDTLMSGEQPQEFTGNNSARIDLKFDPKDTKGQASYFPTPFYTPTSMVLDLVLSNIKYSNRTTGHLPNTRLAMEVLVVHGPGVDEGEIVEQFNSDDEYTPSVFYATSYNVKHNSSRTEGYILWKAISYEDSGRKSSASQQALYNFPQDNGNVSKIPPSLARAFFGGRDDVMVKRMFLVFGTEGDEQSLNGDYFTWTAVLGTGLPAEEQISPVVIIVIIVGFGLPLAVVILGALFLFVQKAIWKPLKRRQLRRQGYQPL